MSLMARWEAVLSDMPLVAILRGVTPDEVVGIGEALIEAGFKVVEVPLNSPDPFVSIEKLVKALGERAIVGAGTVLSVDQVRELARVGGQICISPNANPEVIREAKKLGMISFPAFFTPTEAFTAIEAGADALKLFPGELAGCKGLKAVKAVLPKGLPVFPVGGVDATNMAEYVAAGAAGFGMGSGVYKPGDSGDLVREKATAYVKAWRAI